MLESTHRIALALVVATLLFIASPAFASDHESPSKGIAWDQAKTTELAQQLRKQANSAYDAVYRIQGALGGVGSGQNTDFLELKDRVRLAKMEARHLAGELKEGKGRADTSHSFERMMETVRDIREVGGRMFLDKSILDTFAAAGQTISELAPYYGTDGVSGGPPPLTGAGAK